MSLNFTEELNKLSEKINKRGNDHTPKQQDKHTSSTTTGENKPKTPETSYDITIEEPEKFIPVDAGVVRRLSKFTSSFGVLLSSMLADFVDIVGYYDPTMKQERGTDIMLYARFRTMSNQEYQYLEEKGDTRPRMVLSALDKEEDTRTTEEKEVFDLISGLCKKSENNFDYTKYVKLSSEGKKILSSIVWFADQKKKKYVLNDNPGTPKFAMSNLGNYYFKPEPVQNSMYPGVSGNSMNLYAYVLLDTTILAKKTFVATDDKEGNRKYSFKVYNLSDTPNGDKALKIVRINKDVNMGYYNDGICIVY